MPAFTYTGTHRDTGAPDGNIHPDGIQMYGLWFARGRNVEVTDAFAARKLAGNPYFRAVPDAAAPAAPAGLPVEAPGDVGAALTSDEAAAVDLARAGVVTGGQIAKLYDEATKPARKGKRKEA
jgi:hypothetical protein